MSVARDIVAQMVRHGTDAGRRQGSTSAVRAGILLATGMRCGELKRLTPASVHAEGTEPYVAVPASKGGYARRVPLNAASTNAFAKLGELSGFGEFSTPSLRKSMLAACKALGVEPIYPHVLRHTFASWLVNEGRVSLKTAQKMLGHRSIQTTIRYVREDEKSAREAMIALDRLAA